MITVQLQFRTEGIVVGYVVTGHADYAPCGSDIVCAAVSALTQAALLGLTEHLGLSPRVEIKAGYFSLTLPYGSEADVGVQAILATLALALNNIAEQYPERVCLKEVMV
ncbi:MAG TPA: ribosomal-processing cysteine protease Prp [bacterium]|jgi:uncharacterized protein YsxB (DUF464 family)|nr:ribosomal-processing cysteine protease Prp [bacterium]